MCGIGGIVAAHATADHIESRLAPMLDALRHRGPDDEGRFVDLEGAVGLVHARLSILDLSPAGRQPMSDPTGRYTIVFNGEIYNFGELRGGLEREGWVFRSRTDTEVILALYQKLGEKCVERLRGMYAFAIWDRTDRVCLLARDPLGIKPLYVAERGGCLVFASELRAVMASGLVESNLDASAVRELLRMGTVAEPRSMVRDVRMLPPGSVLEWREGRTASRMWWRMGREPLETRREGGTEEHTEWTRAALRETVKAHFVSDVPVGIFLSGGMDSTAVVGLAAAERGGDLRTFTVGFDSGGLDERKTAASTAARFGTVHTEWRIGAVEARDLFGDYLSRMDQPTIDGFNVFCVSKLARENGVKVVLSGVGGDELFGGYPSFRGIPRMQSTHRALGAVPGLRGLAGGVLRGVGTSRARRLAAFLRGPGGVSSAYRAFRGIRDEGMVEVLAGRLGLGHVEEDGVAAGDLPASGSDLREQVGFLETECYLRNQLLRDADVMSMCWGLEVRTPLVDHLLLEQLHRVPSSLRLAEGKRLLRLAVPEIPESVWGRPKEAFLLPIEEWLKQGWEGVFGRADHLLGPGNHRWYERWSLMTLLVWCERHGVAIG